MSKGGLFLRITLFLALFLISANLLFLDWKLFWEKELDFGQNELGEEILLSPTPTLALEFAKNSTSSQSATASEDDVCPQSCLSTINRAISTSSATKPGDNKVNLKIFYLPLGSGSTKSLEWVDIPGLVTYIDPANFNKVKTFIFEASLRIPTANGQMDVRLYNKNDGRPVWFSDISSQSSTSILIQSQPITFEPGNKLYQVQARTSMGFDSFVDFARIKFVTE